MKFGINPIYPDNFMEIKKFNLEKGNLGENIARKYLEEKGYKILEQNYKNKYGEIDLIAKYKNDLVFIEVKTRIGEQFGIPEDAINRDKVYRIIRNSQAYMLKNQSKQKIYRIDAICIVLNENEKVERINHYENITLDT